MEASGTKVPSLCCRFEVAVVRKSARGIDTLAALAVICAKSFVKRCCARATTLPTTSTSPATEEDMQFNMYLCIRGMDSWGKSQRSFHLSALAYNDKVLEKTLRAVAMSSADLQKSTGFLPGSCKL